MKINFDTIVIKQEIQTTSKSNSPIKLTIQSPIYNQITKQLNPHNYQSQISHINSVINLPGEVSRFIAEQIQRELNESPEKDITNEGYFMSQTCSERNLHMNSKLHQTSTLENSMRSKPNIKPKSNKPHHKKHKCQEKLGLQARKMLKQIHQLTYKPRLYKNAYNRKVQLERQFQIQTKLNYSSVHESLYLDADSRRMKTQISKQIQQQNKKEPKPKINSTFFKNSKVAYKPLYNRLDDILSRRVNRIKEQTKLDITSGRELFKLDLQSSKDSYKWYRESLSKEKLQTKMHKNKAEHTKNNSKKDKHKNCISEIRIQQNSINNKTIEYFTQIFYPEETNLEFSKTAPYQSNLTIKKQQFMILQPFLHEIEELQSKRYELETTISSTRVSNTSKLEGVLTKREFQQKLRKYYKGLTLHDRQILRNEIIKKRKEQVKNKSKEQPLICPTFKPTINIRSASLDNLAKGHKSKIYYV